jgi:hypothetical protein
MKRASPTNLLERVAERCGACLTADTAREMLSIRIDRTTQRRLDTLADKCTEGELTPKEYAEYASLVVSLDLLTLVQAQARAVLGGRRDAR